LAVVIAVAEVQLQWLLFSLCTCWGFSSLFLLVGVLLLLLLLQVNPSWYLSPCLAVAAQAPQQQASWQISPATWQQQRQRRMSSSMAARGGAGGARVRQMVRQQ
jgi:hypothetical protein